MRKNVIVVVSFFVGTICLLILAENNCYSKTFPTIIINGTTAQIPTVLVAAANATQAIKDASDYVCDGIEDDVQINQAISYLKATGGRVQLSEGLFTIGSATTGQIILSNISSITISGVGNGTKLLVKSNSGISDTGIFYASGNVVNVCIEYFTIDGNQSTQTNVQFGFYAVTDKTDNLSWKNIKWQNFKGGAINYSASAANNYHFSSTISNNTVTNCTSHGILVSWMKDSIINNNIVTKCQHAIALTGNVYTTIISGNVCKSNTNDGIYATNISSCTIDENICIGNAGSGIDLPLSTTDNSIVGNTCNGNATDGIIISGSRNTTTGNTSNYNNSNGFYINGSSQTVTGNTAWNNGTNYNKIGTANGSGNSWQAGQTPDP